ncbi:hypothetical protein I203_104527 [Kwoniella mangroviensis CBS 8507]|uniref:uncharacterized protein n=1 Tax=Kwoniella mangroviensis CBS 8507 TaxID=1296122 RepID=UPI003062A071
MIFNLHLITYLIGLSFLYGTCHAQGQAGLPTGGSDNTTNDRNSNGKLESIDLKVHLPSLTKIAVDINNPKSDISGLMVFTRSFKFDESSGILNEWAQKEVWWKVYDPTAKEGEMDDEKDLRFVMNCIVQGSSDSDTDQHTFTEYEPENEDESGDGDGDEKEWYKKLSDR